MIIKLSSAKNDKANFDYAFTLKKSLGTSFLLNAITPCALTYYVEDSAEARGLSSAGEICLAFNVSIYETSQAFLQSLSFIKLKSYLTNKQGDIHTASFS